MKKTLSRGNLWSEKSRYQTVELVRNSGGILFRLNGWPQVHSKEEALYHENVATLPMMLAAKVDRCLILGGGDGLAARNMLRFPGVKSVTLVELDPAVVRLCSTQPDFTRMNEGVFRNPRLKLVVGDAIAWFLKSRGPFDVIINDIELMFTRQPRKVTLEKHFRLFQAMRDKLSPGGVAVATLPDDFEPAVLEGFFRVYSELMPEDKRRAFESTRDVFRRARLLLEVIFPHVRQWTLKFPVLGPHTSYYLSRSPFPRSLRRLPDPRPRGVTPGLWKKVLAG
jgi:spermidine synthase